MTDIDSSVARPTPRRVTPPPSLPPSLRGTAKRRRHPATGARIVALGVGASTMFGLVATMGIAQVRAESTPSGTSETVAPATPAAPLTIVPVTTLPPAPATVPVPTTGAASAPAAPIVLQARPDVRVVTPAAAPAAAPAPVATTRGSN